MLPPLNKKDPRKGLIKKPTRGLTIQKLKKLTFEQIFQPEIFNRKFIGRSPGLYKEITFPLIKINSGFDS